MTRSQKGSERIPILKNGTVASGDNAHRQLAMPVFLDWAEREIRRQLQPFNYLAEYRQDLIVLAELDSENEYDLKFANGYIYVEPYVPWVEETIELNVQHFLQTQKGVFSMGPHSGRMKWFWREKKPNRCEEVSKLRKDVRGFALSQTRLENDLRDANDAASIARAERDGARVRANESLEFLQELRNPNRTGSTSLDIDNAQKLLKFHEDAVKELQDVLGQLKTKAARERMQMAISGKVASARKPEGGVGTSSSSASPSPRPRTSRRGRSRSPLTRNSCSNQKEGVDPAPPSRKGKKAKKRGHRSQ